MMQIQQHVWLELNIKIVTAPLFCDFSPILPY